jgi:fluoride exporter
MKASLLVFTGGGLGSLARYILNRWIAGLFVAVFPYGTFLVNMVGCFLIGFILFYTERYGNNADNWRLFLVTGLCGGFTTFSSFSWENSQLITDHRIFIFLVYAGGSIILGLLATYFGILAGKSL